MGEVAALAQVLTHMGILTRIQEQVRFARARFGTYQRARLKVVRSQTVRLESWDLHRIVW
jgi:hypothetical protein